MIGTAVDVLVVNSLADRMVIGPAVDLLDVGVGFADVFVFDSLVGCMAAGIIIGKAVDLLAVGTAVDLSADGMVIGLAVDSSAVGTAVHLSTDGWYGNWTGS